MADQDGSGNEKKKPTPGRGSKRNRAPMSYGQKKKGNRTRWRSRAQHARNVATARDIERSYKKRIQAWDLFVVKGYTIPQIARTLHVSNSQANEYILQTRDEIKASEIVSKETIVMRQQAELDVIRAKHMPKVHRVASAKVMEMVHKREAAMWGSDHEPERGISLEDFGRRLSRMRSALAAHFTNPSDQLVIAQAFRSMMSGARALAASQQQQEIPAQAVPQPGDGPIETDGGVVVDVVAEPAAQEEESKG